MSITRSSQHGERGSPGGPRDMHEYSIHYDGCAYEYNGYRYDHLDDALAYARLMRSRPQQQDPRGPYRLRSDPGAESETSKRRMAALGIELKDGRFCYRDFRYDRLTEAVDYALLEQRRQAAAQRSGTP